MSMPQYNIDHYRSLFPFLKNGTLYFDHASIGPLPTPTRSAVETYLLQRSEREINVFLDFLKIHQATKDRVGTLLNAPKERIAFCDNTSNGLNLLAAGFPWKTGDRILLTDMEFPANVYPFLNQKRHGVEVDFVKNRSGEILFEDIEHAITPSTRVLSISYVQFLHGFRADLAAIGDLCKRKGIIFSVDAIQAAGTVPIDVQAMKIDFLSCGGQKWLLSPEGISFVYVSEELQSRIHQAHLGWMSIDDFFSDFFRHRMELDPTARRFENGTLNIAGIVGLHASLGLLLEAGIQNIQHHLGDLTQFLIERLKEKKLEIITPDDPARRSGIVTFRPPDAKKLFEELRARKIVVSLREGCIRFSPHFYNTTDEITRALDLMLP